MEKLFYPTVFHPEQSGYSVSVPDLDGCFSEGDSISEAYNMIFDAIGLYLEELRSSGGTPPVPSNPAAITVEKPDFITLIEFDRTAYMRRHGTHSVKKTLTIPEWLNTLAEEKHINFSSVLKDALIEHLDVH